MAKNNLTPMQDIAVRKFYTQVVQDTKSTVWAGAEAARKAAEIACLELLNYYLYEGKYVSKDKVQPTTYGHKQDLECEWEADTLAAEAGIYEANNNSDTNQADSGQSSESAEVREAILRENV